MDYESLVISFLNYLKRDEVEFFIFKFKIQFFF